jgi:hypothetical protein
MKYDISDNTAEKLKKLYRKEATSGENIGDWIKQYDVQYRGSPRSFYLAGTEKNINWILLKL